MIQSDSRFSIQIVYQANWEISKLTDEANPTYQERCSMIFFVIIILATVIVTYRFIRSESRGPLGEARVARQLKAIQNINIRVFNDVLLRVKRGTSQIDHVIISIYGIFVIETKNYSGWIHGNENSEYWTQTFYKTRNKFRNPVKQNWAHIYALKEVLWEFEEVPYYSIVVFTGDAELKNISSTIPVIYSHQLIDTIEDIAGMATLSIEQVRDISDRLSNVTIRDRKADKEHVYQVQTQLYERKQKERSLICPKCEGDLVVRNGKYGKFYGCSNYPKCRYTLPYTLDQY